MEQPALIDRDAQKTEAGLLRTEASRFERLSKTGTATQQDLGHVLRLA